KQRRKGTQKFNLRSWLTKPPDTVRVSSPIKRGRCTASTPIICTSSLRQKCPSRISIATSSLPNATCPCEMRDIHPAFGERQEVGALMCGEDRKSTRLNSSHVKISYAV